jgi:hypothetical protein
MSIPENILEHEVNQVEDAIRKKAEQWFSVQTQSHLYFDMLCNNWLYFLKFARKNPITTYAICGTLFVLFFVILFLPVLSGLFKASSREYVSILIACTFIFISIYIKLQVI